MSEKYLTYKKFNSEQELAPFVDFLNEKMITYQLEDDTPNLDPIFGGQKVREIQVKIRQDEFLIVDKLIEHWAQKNNEIVDKTHYLYEFTNEELIEILQKSDEWSKEDFILAKDILLSRRIDITEKSIEELHEKRLEELRKPEKYSSFWKTIGYITAFLGGLLGIFIGLSLNTTKKTLPNGERVYMYKESDRKSGARMFIIGVVSFILWGILGIYIKIKMATSY